MTEISANTDVPKIRLWETELPVIAKPRTARSDMPLKKHYLGVPVMTELSENRVPDPINPIAFIIALLGAPLVTALTGLVMLFTLGMFELNFGLLMLFGYVLVGATIVGGLPYLLIGTPGLIYALRAFGRHARFGNLAFIGHICSLPVILAGLFALGATDEIVTILVYGILGGVFAPLWGTLFAIIYYAIVDRGARNV